MSTQKLPKQFLDLLGTGESLLQETYKRVSKIFEAERIFVITQKGYVGLVKRHLPGLPTSQIIAEPLRRNTAACIGLAALKLKKREPMANLFFTPSDQVIEDEEAFVEVIKKGLKTTDTSDCFVTIGIPPLHPETGYGYIQYNTDDQEDGVYSVRAFTEKPDLAHAELFIDSGDFLWNSGMFIWNVDALTNGLDQHLPELMSNLGEVWDDLDTPYETDSLARVYGSCENISIDYGLMERAEKVCVIPASIGWYDIGNWGSIYKLAKKDAQGNAIIGTNVLAENCSNCLLVNTDSSRALVLRDLSDRIVIQTEKTVLGFPRGNDQAIKSIVKSVKLGLGESFT